MRKFILCLILIWSNFSWSRDSSFDSTSSIELKGADVVFTVGLDQACDFNDIQTALSAVPDNSLLNFDLRITNQQEWDTNLIIIKKDNLSIGGRYSNCVDAEMNLRSGGRSIINNISGSSAGIYVSQSDNLLLNLLEVKNGHNSGVIVSNNSTVIIDNLEIHSVNKTLGNGGGILINNSTVGIFFSYIENNVANNGAGLACNGGVVNVFRTAINANQTNTTNSSGGGVYAEDCIIDISSTTNGTSIGLGVTNNQAARYGAGIYVSSGTILSVNGLGPKFELGQMFIDNNTISNTVTNLQSGGAGIYATGANTEVYVHMTAIGHNSIEDDLQFVGGAAIAIDDQATFIMSPSETNINCMNSDSSDRSCNQIKNNITKSGDAAVIKITGGAQAEIYNTSIFGNETASNTNQLATVFDGSLTIQGALIYDNGTTPNPPQIQTQTRLIRVSPAGTFHGDFLTIADNRLWGGWVIQSIGSSKVNLTRSIIAEDPIESVLNDSINNPSTKLFKCLLTHENSSFIGTDITVGTPTFQPTLPYRLDSGSLGVNACTNEIGDLLPQADIDGEERGPCPGICSTQRFDAGADEFTNTDLIFKNGFSIIL